MNYKLFQKKLLHWFDQHGRKHLPWQENKLPYRVWPYRVWPYRVWPYRVWPYRVWISEIMLQQTQVNTVIPYFERFIKHFPDLTSLAEADEDEVLHLWSGLGYYSRARHLHLTAKRLVEKHNGRFPDNLEDLQQLPGIGRSTAGAILAIGLNQPATILDGNVKRVLSRFYAITEPINDKKTEKKLWELAEQLTPKKRVADYTQAIMDLGATVCLRKKARCPSCPLIKYCAAYQKNLVDELPKKSIKSKIPTRTATFLILKKNDDVLLQKRSPLGIWGGLWSLPEIVGKPSMSAIKTFCQRHFKLKIIDYLSLKSFRHTFSHYHLNIFPILIEIKPFPRKVMETNLQTWYNLSHPKPLGLPKPVQVLLHDTIHSLHKTQ